MSNAGKPSMGKRRMVGGVEQDAFSGWRRFIVTDLVPQAAIDAAMRARWQTGVRWLTQGTDDTPDTSLRNQLEAAAPHIIEAARPAIEAAFREKWAGPNRDKCQWWCEQYVQCQCGAVNDELEEDDSV